MPLFICDVCSGIENTALGFFHGRDNRFVAWKDPKKNKKALCSECTPVETSMGEPYGGGKWHGEFPKEIATVALVIERGLWPKNYLGFIYLGKFESLRKGLE